MLIPILVLLGVGGIVGSYAFFPSSWRKAKHRLTRDKRRREGILYLTFDDGPSAEDTPALLDLLARFQVPATFFVVGEFARDNPQLIHRMREEGHQVAFHSARHHSAYLMSPRQTRQDFADGLAELANLGIENPCFRPPLGGGESGFSGADQEIPPAGRAVGRNGPGLAGGHLPGGDRPALGPAHLAGRSDLPARRPGCPRRPRPNHSGSGAAAAPVAGPGLPL